MHKVKARLFYLKHFQALYPMPIWDFFSVGISSIGILMSYQKNVFIALVRGGGDKNWKIEFERKSWLRRLWKFPDCVESCPSGNRQSVMVQRNTCKLVKSCKICHSAMDSVLASHPGVPGSIPGIPKKFPARGSTWSPTWRCTLTFTRDFLHLIYQLPAGI